MPDEPSRRSLVRREAVLAGVGAAVVAAFVMAIVVASKGRQSLFRNDAEFFWLVARDPFADGSIFHPFAHEMGSAYRYGRVLFPLVAWLLVLGRASLVQWSLMVVDVVMFGVTVALACEWAGRRGRDHARGIAVLLVPAMWFALVLAVSEPLVLALVLLMYLLDDGERRVATLVTAALLLLAREAAVVAILPLVARDLRARAPRRVASWALVVVPLAAWWVWVRVRVGEWPFLDPSISRREALSAPFAGAVTVVREGAGADHWLAFVLGALTVVAAVWVFRTHRWFPVAHGALAFAVVIPFFGANAWRYPGEAIRLLGPAQVLVALARIGAPVRSRRHVDRPHVAA
jgi:hypothetical protein